MTDQINIQGIYFNLYVKASAIEKSVKRVSLELEKYYSEMPLLLSVLNGAFIFTADLSRSLRKDHCIEFIKYQSYDGMERGEGLKNIIGIEASRIQNQSILIVEDIVDTGKTLDLLTEELYNQGAKEVECATAFFKPESFKGKKKPRFIGMECEDLFLIGYGLDYNGWGRNLKDLYIKADHS